MHVQAVPNGCKDLGPLEPAVDEVLIQLPHHVQAVRRCSMRVSLLSAVSTLHYIQLLYMCLQGKAVSCLNIDCQSACVPGANDNKYASWAFSR